MHLIQLQCLTHSLCRRFAVTGQHCQTIDAGTAQFPHCLGGIRLDGIGDEQIAGIHAIHGNMHCRARLPGHQRFQPSLLQIRCITGEHFLSVHQRRNTMAGGFLNVLHTRDVQFLSVCLTQ